MGKIIVVTSGKGGTGKSTITAALGVAFAKKGRSTLLLDCDWGLKSLDILLGVSENVVYNLRDILAGECEPIRAIYSVPDVEGLSLIPAPDTNEIVNRYDDFKYVCGILADCYDYVIIDSPAGIDASFKFAVTPADLALVVVNPDPVSIRDGDLVGSRLEQCGVKNSRLIINRFHKSVLKYSLTSDLDKIIDGTSLQLIGIIPDDKKIQAAALNCVPLTVKCPASKAIDRIASRIEGENIVIPNRL